MLSARNESDQAQRSARVALESENKMLLLELEKMRSANIAQSAEKNRLEEEIAALKECPGSSSQESKKIQQGLGEGLDSSQFSREFTIGRSLGTGKMGSVFEAESRLDQWKCAVKRIAADESMNCDQTVREIRTICQFDHPGLVRYHNAWIEKEDSSDGHCRSFIYIQMQLCEYSLEAWLESNQTRSSRSPSRMLSWFSQLVSAVGYIHKKQMIHSNIKPSSIFFLEEDCVKLKIPERIHREKFPGAVTISASNLFLMRSMRPSSSDSRPLDLVINYSAPEQIAYEYSSKADVFSLGLILAELCTPMTREQTREVFDSSRSGSRKISIPLIPDAEMLVSRLTNVDPAARPTCKEILENHQLHAAVDAKFTNMKYRSLVQARSADNQLSDDSSEANYGSRFKRLRMTSDYEDEVGMEIPEEKRSLHAQCGRKLHEVCVGTGYKQTKFLLPEEYARNAANKDFVTITSGYYGVAIRTLRTTSLGDNMKERKSDEVVVTRLHHSSISGASMARTTIRQLSLLQKLDHPNISQLLDVFTSASDANDLKDVYIVTKFAGSTLREILIEQIRDKSSDPKSIEKHLPMNILPTITRDILSALKYLKAVDVRFCVLRPSNLSIDSSGRVTFLVDWDLSPTKHSLFETEVSRYQAIEDMMRASMDVPYRPEADIWSLGCILAEIITWHPLFEPNIGKFTAKDIICLQIARCGPISEECLDAICKTLEPTTAMQLKQFINRKKTAIDQKEDLKQYLKECIATHNKISRDDSKEVVVVDFICECLKLEPSKRITIDDALQHPFVGDKYSPEDYSHVKRLSDEIDGRNVLVEWKQQIFNDIQNFKPRELM